MATSLKEQRDKILARHRALESVPGSGWHARDPHMKAQAQDAEDQGHVPVPLSQRPVAFQCNEEVVVVGECVGKVVAGLKAFDQAAKDDPTYENTAKGDKQMRQTIDRVAAFCARPAPADELRVPTSVWNSYVHALGLVGVQVVLTDGLFHDTPRQKLAHGF